MGAEIVFFNTSPGKRSLHNFNETLVVQLQVREGTYVIIGRVVIINTDSDAQYCSARLITIDDQQELDRVDVRLGGKEDASVLVISLQATFSVESGNAILDIRCASYGGFAEEASIIAIKVDDIVQFAP